MPTPRVINKSYVSATPIKIRAKGIKSFTIWNRGTSELFYNIDDDATNTKIPVAINQIAVYKTEDLPIDDYISVFMTSGGSVKIMMGSTVKTIGNPGIDKNTEIIGGNIIV